MVEDKPQLISEVVAGRGRKEKSYRRWLKHRNRLQVVKKQIAAGGVGGGTLQVVEDKPQLVAGGGSHRKWLKNRTHLV